MWDEDVQRWRRGEVKIWRDVTVNTLDWGVPVNRYIEAVALSCGLIRGGIFQ